MAKTWTETTSVVRNVTGKLEMEPYGGWRVRGEVRQYVGCDGIMRRMTEFEAMPYLRVVGIEDSVMEKLTCGTKVNYEERSMTVKTSPSRKLMVSEKTYVLSVASRERSLDKEEDQ